MSLRLPTRTLAPVLVLAVLAGIVATFVIARPPSAADETPTLVRPKPAKPAPVRKPAPAQAKPRAKAPAKPKPIAPVATPSAAKPPAPEDGLPRALSSALAANRVVVVGLYDPDSPLDRMALAEARAGAGAADAGFVAINVLADPQSRPLLVKLGALENPGVLVYRKPDSLYARISGFADSETVAQAAANALR